MYELTYKRAKDARDARQDARRIKLAMEQLKPKEYSRLHSDLERSVYMMVLCAGNQISLRAPLDIQFLYACQRISDYHDGRVMTSPEEVERMLTLCHARLCVVDVLDRLEGSKRGN